MVALMTVSRGGWSLESFSGPHGRSVLALHGSHAQGTPFRAGLIVHCGITCALQQRVVSQSCSDGVPGFADALLVVKPAAAIRTGGEARESRDAPAIAEAAAQDF